LLLILQGLTTISAPKCLFWKRTIRRYINPGFNKNNYLLSY